MYLSSSAILRSTRRKNSDARLGIDSRSLDRGSHVLEDLHGLFGIFFANLAGGILLLGQIGRDLLGQQDLRRCRGVEQRRAWGRRDRSAGRTTFASGLAAAARWRRPIDRARHRPVESTASLFADRDPSVLARPGGTIALLPAMHRPRFAGALADPRAIRRPRAAARRLGSWIAVRVASLSRSNRARRGILGARIFRTGGGARG